MLLKMASPPGSRTVHFDAQPEMVLAVMRHLEDGTGEPGLHETVRDDGDSGEDGRWWVMLSVPLSQAGR